MVPDPTAQSSGISSERVLLLFRQVQHLPPVAGIVAIVLGGIGLASWHLDLPALSRNLPQLAAVPYNSALALVACGASLLLLLKGQRNWSAGLALLAVGLGVMSGIQYVSGIDMGVDGLLTNALPVVRPASILRMAPNGAICLTFIGATLFFMNGRPQTWKQNLLLSMLATIAFGFSMLALFGYVSGIESAYAWGSFSRMTLHFSLAFPLISVSLIVLIWSVDAELNAQRGRLIVVPIMTGMLITTFGFWLVLDRFDRDRMGRLIQYKVNFLAASIESTMAGFIIAADRIYSQAQGQPHSRPATGQTVSYVLPEGAWILEAGRTPGAQVFPPPATSPVAFPEGVRTVLKQMTPGQTVVVPHEVTGEFLLAVYLHDTADNSGAGMVAASRVDSLLARIDQLAGATLHFALSSGDRRVWASDSGGSVSGNSPTAFESNPQADPGRYLVEGKVVVQGLVFDYTARPTQALLRDELSHLPSIFAAIGTSFTLLLSALIYLVQSVLRHDYHLQESYRQLSEKSVSLARSNEELEQYATITAHDLQEPLRSISGFCQILDTRYRDRLDDSGREYLDFVVAGARQLQDLITGLLNYTRLPKMELYRQNVDFSDVIRTVSQALSDRLKAAGATVHSSPMPVMFGNRSLFEQLVYVLMDNALKFRGEAAPRIDIHAVRDESTWIFTFRDNGIGIAPEYHGRIFEMFKRLHSRDKYTGTGLGLALARRIVERYGGRISVLSAPGEGATFTFSLPVTPEQKQLS